MRPLSTRLRKLSPAALLLYSYLAVILAGALLLWLPWATVSGRIPFIDALFTAASAVCVTGLIVVDTGSYFSPAGQAVILVLIQAGGLGIMTITVALYRLIGRRVPLEQRMAVQDVFTHTPRRDIYDLIRSVVTFTVVVEAAGVVGLFVFFSRQFPPARALYLSVFHSVSAFCNAGFSLFSDSFMNYRTSPLLNGTICGLIILGGLGFPVIFELLSLFRKKRNGRFMLSVQAKTVLLTSAVLIVAGALMFLITETLVAKADPSSPATWLTALFQSVTARTAGFNTVDIASLGDATLALLIFLMFFGASPGSCGGGIKTTTLAVLSLNTLSRLRGKQRVDLFKRSIPPETVHKSISLFIISVALISLALYGLLFLQEMVPTGWRSDRPFLGYLFEVVSAFGTVGLSMGATPNLNTGAKILVIVLMLIGRLGIPAFSYLLVGAKPGDGPHHAEEKIMLG